MFTGIIEKVGTVVKIQPDEANIHFTIQSEISTQLKIDQSVSHDGVCLTVVDTVEGTHNITAVNETLLVSNLKSWKVGTNVNLERCMIANGRFDGHIVQGHVDCIAKVVNIEEQNGSYLMTFETDSIKNKKDMLAVEKGSITVNGVSLTCFAIDSNHFNVAIIPYTYQNTNFNQLSINSFVNIEYDIIGKYVAKLLSTK